LTATQLPRRRRARPGNRSQHITGRERITYDKHATLTVSTFSNDAPGPPVIEIPGLPPITLPVFPPPEPPPPRQPDEYRCSAVLFES